MIIPIRCFTCGKVLADKWEYYIKKANEIDEEYNKLMMKKYSEEFDKDENDEEKNENKENKVKTYKYIESTYKKDILDELGLNKMCCRRHMISNVDMMGKI